MATLLSSIKLPIFVDCLEFSPTHPDLLACGLYQLRDDQTRIGGVEILQIDRSITDHNSDEESTTNVFASFATIQIEDAGVLAVRWTIDGDRLICACSDSKLRTFALDHSTKSIRLENSRTILDDNILLCVELDQPTNDQALSPAVLIGHSNGSISLGSLDDSPLTSWSAHDRSEVWSVEFHRGDSNLLFSGADDCLLKMWDRLSSASSAAVATFRHDAGVTSIMSTRDPHKVFTGSYDDHLRLWDSRNRKSPLSSLDLGGGVWRIRARGNQLLCACMYNGWSIVECGGDPLMGDNGCERFSVKYTDDSCGTGLLYGIDWVPGMDRVVSSTFYDYTVRMYCMD